MSEVHYAIEHHNNKAVFSIHLSVEVPIISTYEQNKMNRLSRDLKEALLKIPGVIEVYASNMAVRITRGGAFSVKDVLPDVLAVLSQHLASDSVFIEVQLYRNN